MSQVVSKLGRLLKDPVGVLKSRFMLMKTRQTLGLRRYFSRKGLPSVPEPPVWQFPEGFTVSSVGDTGVRVIDNFLSEEESAEVIKLYGDWVKKSTVIGPGGESILHDYRTSSDTLIRIDSNPIVQAIIYRAATLFGVPSSHAEKFSLTRYKQGEYYKSHFDHDGSLKADRLYTLLIYLNGLTVEEGGGTLFDDLNLVAHPVCGRAVVWPNSDLDAKSIPESVHSALPVLGEGAEKWVAQLWFRAYRVGPKAEPVARRAPQAGKPLSQASELPPGVSLAETVVAKPEQ